MADELTIKRYFAFEGKATRQEYWAIMLITTLFVFVGQFMAGFLEAFLGNAIFVILIIIATLLVLCLQVATIVRRLRDAELNRWWIVTALIPILSLIPLIVFGCLPSKKEKNDAEKLSNYT